MDEFIEHLEYSKVLFYIVTGTIILTYVIHFFFKEYRYPKYMPGLLLIIIGGFTLFTTEYGGSGIISIDNIFMGIVAFGSGIVGLFFGLILGVYNKEKKKKKIKED